MPAWLTSPLPQAFKKKKGQESAEISRSPGREAALQSSAARMTCRGSREQGKTTTPE